MKIAILLLVTCLVITPTSALAQMQHQPNYEPTITWPKQDREKILRMRINQQIQTFNTNVEQVIKETRDIKQFSNPYLVEFPRRNERMQHHPDVPFLRFN
ncbi:hypothetical protein ACE1AT_12820 [Pelatocladus sp. BLCC-F211]|uniref:hypothetical protein n=1 Tax=Pelatocladus sp. BLCC-F211 TaxID=3342752 RepID=UPI0035BAAB2A